MKLFKKNRTTASATETIESWNYSKIVRKIGNRTFKSFWEVLDSENGYKAIKRGFETRAEAIAYAETTSAKWYINAYDIEL